jgi:cholesterol transport system auxiliary component
MTMLLPSPARLAAIASLALLAAGCFGGGDAPAQLLTLTPSQLPEAGTTRSAGQSETITVSAPAVPRAVSTTRIPVYVSPTSIQYLVNATWVEEPAELFRRLLGETITAQTGRLVLEPGVTTAVQAVLGGQLHQFGLDPARNEVVVVYEATLSRGRSAVTSQRFEARVPVATPDAAAVAPALNLAANQVAQQVAAWIGR